MPRGRAVVIYINHSKVVPPIAFWKVPISDEHDANCVLLDRYGHDEKRDMTL